MTEQLFNYKVLTDSTTNEQFYCIDKQEFVTLVQDASRIETSREITQMSYRAGFLSGVVWMVVGICLYKMIVQMMALNVKGKMQKKEVLNEETKNNQD